MCMNDVVQYAFFDERVVVLIVARIRLMHVYGIHDVQTGCSVILRNKNNFYKNYQNDFRVN